MGKFISKRRKFVAVIVLCLALALVLYQALLVQAVNKLVNGSFTTNLTSWTSSTAPGAVWDSAGYANGGALRMEASARGSATGFMYQNFTVGSSEVNQTASLTFAWKKYWTGGTAPTTQDIRIRLLQPGSSTPVDLWTDTTILNTNTWSTRTVSLNSSLFQTAGSYQIQLYANFKGSTSNSLTQAWFDEVSLDLAQAVDKVPPTFGITYFSDSSLSVPLPVNGAGFPVAKAQQVFVRVTANEPLKAAPTLTITAPGTANNLSSNVPASTSGNNYVYTWNVVKDVDGNASVAVTGTDSAGNTGSVATSGGTVAIDTTVNPPTLDSAVASLGKVDLTWSTSLTDIDHFEVHRSSTSGFTPGSGTLIAGNVTNTSYSDTTVGYGQTYFYKVVAVDKVGNVSGGSNQLSVTTPSDNIPPTLTVGYYSDSAMTVPLPTDGSGRPMAKAQTVYVKTSASESLKSVPTITIDAPGTANDKTNVAMTLVSGNVYQYTWTVTGGAGLDGSAAVTVNCSDLASNPGSYKGTAIINTQITVPNLTATGGPAVVNLAWGDPDTDIVNFKVYRSTTSGFTPNDSINLLVTLGNVTSFNDNSASYPNTYYYVVRAIDVVGNVSAFSNQASASPQKVNPHGSYSTATFMCAQCHDSHQSQGQKLEAQADVTATCYLCHDAGGQSDLKVDSEFAGTSHHNLPPTGNTACTDCHNPHNDGTTNVRLLQSSSGQTGGNEFCWTCHGTGSTLPAPNGDHQTNYPVGSGHNNPTWTAANGKTPFDPPLFESPTSTNKTQIGCLGCHEEHGSNLNKLLRGVDWNNDGVTPTSTTVTSSSNKEFCYECHNGPGSQSDNAWFGKSTYDANISKHPGSTANCTNSYCHDPHNKAGNPDYLRLSYNQTTTGSTWNPSNFQTCGGCHDVNAMVDTSKIQSSFYDNVSGKNLHQAHLNNSNTGYNATCKDCHDPHGTKPEWNSSGEQMIAFASASVTARSGQASPKWTDGAVGSTGKGSCDLVCHGVTHTSDGSGGVKAVYDSAGVAPPPTDGGGPCYTCHTSFTSMASTNTGVYRHGMMSDLEDYTLSSKTCLTCHVNHDIFNDTGRANNLRPSAAPGSPTPTSGTGSDFNALDTTNGGLCLSCHNTSQTVTTTEPDNKTSLRGLPVLDYKNSAHNYSVNSTYTKDSSSFSANCSKCHNDNASSTKLYQTNNSGSGDVTKAFGLHFSTLNRLLAPFNYSSVPSPYEEQYCYKCHGTNIGKDYYGYTSSVTTAMAVQQVISATGGKTYRHPVENSDPLRAANRPVECMDCHGDVHKTARNNWRLPASPGGEPSVPISGVLKGAKGVNITSWGSATQGSYSSPTGYTALTPDQVTEEWQVCIRCHSSYDSTVTAGSSKDIAQFMNPAYVSTHGITPQPHNPAPNIEVNRKTLLKEPWASATSLPLRVLCTDCHGNSDTATAKGPHGSNNQYILKWDPKTQEFCLACHNAKGAITGSNGGLAHSNSNHQNPTAGANYSTVFQPNYGTNYCRACHFGSLKNQSVAAADKPSTHGSNRTWGDGTSMASTDPALNGFYIYKVLTKESGAATPSCQTLGCNHDRTPKNF